MKGRRVSLSVLLGSSLFARSLLGADVNATARVTRRRRDRWA